MTSQDTIQAFADLTGDQQWIHVDVERNEKESPFGGPRLISVPVQLSGIDNAVDFGCGGARFLSPVPSGSTVHVKGNEKPSLLHTSQILHQG